MLAQPLAAIRTVRPDLSLMPRAILEAILLTEGPIGTAERVGHGLGLSRFQLARMLRREGLPPLHVMAGWAMVLSWLLTAEHDHVSLCWIAFHVGRHPSTCYRLVKEVTGLSWEQARARGAAWAEREFLKELHALQE
jgi:AraC-like DNA-binding protein